MIELPPVPSGSAALTDKEGRATRPLQSFLNAIRTAFATVVDSLLPLHLTDANTVEQYNGTTAQAWRLYNTRTDASNYERLDVSWSANVVRLNAEFAGTGVQRNIALQTGGGNVGVGMTPTGAVTLDIATSLRITHRFNSFQLYDTTTGPTAGGLARFTSLGNGTYAWQINTAAGANFSTALFAYAVDSGARVGFGITTMTAKVHIAAGTAAALTAPLKFTAGTNNTTAEAGAVEYDGSSVHYTDGSARRATVPRVLFTQTADQTVANTATETTLFGTGVGSLTLPANFFVVGRTIRVYMVGYVSDTGSPTMGVRLRLGTAVLAIAQSGTIVLSGTRPFIIEALLTCRTTGATGAFMAQISQRFASTGDGTYSMTTATVAANTAASQALDVTLAWGTADALNTATITNAVVEVLN